MLHLLNNIPNPRVQIPQVNLIVNFLLEADLLLLEGVDLQVFVARVIAVSPLLLERRINTLATCVTYATFRFAWRIVKFNTIGSAELGDLVLEDFAAFGLKFVEGIVDGDFALGGIIIWVIFCLIQDTRELLLLLF